jgi:hypothetical protein
MACGKIGNGAIFFLLGEFIYEMYNTVETR